LFAQLSKAIDLTQRIGRGEKGQLRVGFTSLVTYDLLPVILLRFREQFPEVELILQELTTTQQEQALFNRHIHVGFAHPPLEDNTLNTECIQQERLIVALIETHFLARQENISVRDLLDENFIMFPRHLGPGLYDQILSFCQQGNFSPKVAIEAIQMQTIIGLVSAGIGIAIVPSSLQNFQRAGVVYHALEEKTPLVETAVVWRQEEMIPVLREFLQIVRSVCG
jgi:DNA-binding transcriptional LysR family regulator